MRSAEPRLEQLLEPAGEQQGALAQGRQAAAANWANDACNGHHPEQRVIADLPAGGAAVRPERLRHLEARVEVVAPPAGQPRRCAVEVALVHEGAGCRAGPSVQVLVRAPGREIRVPVVQRERQVADRVREVETGDRADAMRGRRRVPRCRGAGRSGTGRPAAGRARAATPRRSISATMSSCRSSCSPARGADLDQDACRIAAVPADLRRDRITVRRKRALLDQDHVPLARRAVEARHQEVQVDRERVHHDRLRAASPRQAPPRSARGARAGSASRPRGRGSRARRAAATRP